MANVTITDLPGLSVLNSTGQFPVVSSGTTYNITANVMRTFMTNANGSISVNSDNSDTAIVNVGTNGVGNIGSSSSTFNTVFAKSTTAQYADLAECYTADKTYPPGTVVSIGGSAEVTASTQDADVTVVGVISTNPAYTMNSGVVGDYVVTVALMGRVPCLVNGPVNRGQMMVSAGNGCARAEINPAMGTVIGKALQDHGDGPGTIEIIVGRL